MTSIGICSGKGHPLRNRQLELDLDDREQVVYIYPNTSLTGAIGRLRRLSAESHSYISLKRGRYLWFTKQIWNFWMEIRNVCKESYQLARREIQDGVSGG